jgi:hypothetical protein
MANSVGDASLCVADWHGDANPAISPAVSCQVRAGSLQSHGTDVRKLAAQDNEIMQRMACGLRGVGILARSVSNHDDLLEKCVPLRIYNAR